MQRMLAGFAAAFALAVTPAAAQKISDDVVKIGLILDMSSIYADITGKGSADAGQMAIDDFGGKVLGKPIELVYADHQNKADIAAAKAREWFENDHVDAILDVAASATALAALEVAKSKNKIIVFNGPAATRLTNEACAPLSVHWAYDTYALAHGTGYAMVKQGYDTWFFITADYAFGQDLERDTTAVVTENGGKVLGSVRAPINTPDFSSFLLQAQGSKAKVIALANAGADTTNAIKQAAEFGIVKGGQNLAGMLVFITDVNALGLEKAQGMLLTTAFYWDMNDETRAWSKRFFEKEGRMPTMAQAGVYSSVTHYLKAVQAAGTDESEAVMAKMRETPVNDFFVKNGKIREDGRMVHDMYLVEVKSPAESKAPWDYYKIKATIPAAEAFQPLSASRCPLVKK
ncbi:MAG TPA: ABC transporter substrate-binding protein [Xanthobacteraceae bacterium]|nr:ABC transporter substrate-binding protein [Xanthobacteraceae bacterium]